MNLSTYIGGKTSKTEILPGFCKIEHGSGSDGMLPCYRGLIWLGRARRAGGAPVTIMESFDKTIVLFRFLCKLQKKTLKNF